MIVPKTDSKGDKSKIILPKNPSTTLMPKKKKITTNTTNMRKISMYFYKKSNISTVLASPTIQNSLTIHHKVHSSLVLKFNKV